MKIGQRIRAERLRLGLTQVELARKIDVGSDSVSRYERDLMVPSVRALRALARLFELTMDELMSDRGGSRPAA